MLLQIQRSIRNFSGLVLLLVISYQPCYAQNRMVLPIGSISSRDGERLSPSGKLMAFAGFRDNAMSVYNLNTGLLLATLSDPDAYRGYSDIEFSNDETRVIGKLKEQADIRIWDLATAKCIYAPNTATHEDYHFLEGTFFAAKANRILKITPETVKVTEGNKFTLLHEFKLRGIEGFKFSNNGKMLAIILEKGVKLYDTKTWLPIFPNPKVKGMAVFSEDDKYLLITTKDKILCYDLATKKTMEHAHTYRKPYAYFNGRQIELMNGSSYIERYSLDDKVWKPYPKNNGLCFDPQDQYMIIYPYNEADSILITDQKTQRILFSAPNEDSLRFSRDGKYLIQLKYFSDTTDADSNTVTIWDRDLKTKVGYWQTKTNETVAYNDILDKMISAGEPVLIKEVLTGRTLAEISTAGHIGYSGRLKLSESGKTLSGASKYLWDTETMQLKAAATFGPEDDVDDILFTGDSNYALIGGANANHDSYHWELWDLTQNLLLHAESFNMKEDANVLKAIQKDGKTIVIAIASDSVSKLQVYHPGDMENPVHITLTNPNVESVSIAPDDACFLVSYGGDGADNGYTEIRAANGVAPTIIKGHILNNAEGIFSNDGKLLLTTTEDKILIYNTQTWKIVQTIPASIGTSPHFSKDNKYIFNDSFFSMINVKNPKASPVLLQDQDAAEMTKVNDVPMKLSNDGKRVISSFFTDGGTIGQGKDSNIWDITTEKNLLPDKMKFLENIYANNQGTRVYTSDYSSIRTSYLYNLNPLSKITIPAFSANVKDALFTRDDRYLLVSTYGELIKINAKTGKVIAKSFAIDNGDYITTIPAGYYMATPNASKYLHYITPGLNTITFDQLDIKYNRPDKVLQSLGSTDTALINSYKRAYDKRIKKLNIDTNAFKTGYSIPQADFKNREGIKYEQDKQELTLHITSLDKSTVLDRFNVWINESPLFGLKGRTLKAKNSNSLDTTITVLLSDFGNKIETSVINVNGIESYRIPLYVNYTPKAAAKEELHFVGIGINRFADSTMNLGWSVKDIRDLAQGLKQKYGENCIIDTLFDEQVTVQNVLLMKEKLAKSSINDKVILAYSGHGLLNKDYDYFLSTYNVNFTKPEENGLSYDALENLLDGIPARKKLLLIDACHSGEVDKEELARYAAAQSNLARNQVKNTRGITLLDDGLKKAGMKTSIEIMQQLFANVNRSTGATVISAAGGTQFALEKSDLKNGVFTYSLLEFMKKNSHANVNELKKYVNKRVSELTAGLQVPNARSETNAGDWQVW